MFIWKFRDLFYYQAATEIEIVTLKVEHFYLKIKPRNWYNLTTNKEIKKEAYYSFKWQKKGLCQSSLIFLLDSIWSHVDIL